MPSFFLEESQGKRLEMGVGETMFLEPSLQRNAYNISEHEVSLMKHTTAGFSAKFPKLVVESSLYRTCILRLESYLLSLP